MNLARAQGDSIGLAVAAILIAVLALSLGDAVIKLVSVGFPLWQIFVLRSLIVLPLLTGFMYWRRPDQPLLPRSAGWTALRSFMLCTMWIAYYAALPEVLLSVAAAAYYTAPLFIVIFAGLFTRDRIGWHHALAIALGFGGVLLMLRPDAEGLHSWALLPLASAMLYAAAMILTRTRCRDESPLVLSLALNATFVAVGGGAGLLIAMLEPGAGAANRFLLGPWTPLGVREGLALGVLAVAILAGSIGAAVAYQAGPPATVASFDYAYLAFSVLWGLLFFAELPELPTVAGMVMIAAGGLIAVRRRSAATARGTAPPRSRSARRSPRGSG